MVDFLRKRLQIFVSSTYSDLRHERQAAVEAILVAGHIPAGMELFTAGDESQMEAINQWIDESDVYLLILGGRYGSIEPTSSKSYTRLEYEYALKLGKPMFACVINESALEQRVKAMGLTAVEGTDPAGLREFRTLVLSKLVRFWDDSKDIKISVGETLSHFARREDLVGWVRPSEYPADVSKLADEIARLSRENAQLRERPANPQAEPMFLGFTFDELMELLQRKNLLHHLVRNWSKLMSMEGLARDPAGKCEELRFLGLLDTSMVGIGTYRVTDSGKLFLNRLELMRLREKATSSGAGAA